MTDSASIPPKPSAPKLKLFRKKFEAPRLSPEAVERQSRATLFAWNILGGDAAIAFLNRYHDGLEGRPLDIAVASAEGCEAVELAIAAYARGD